MWKDTRRNTCKRSSIRSEPRFVSTNRGQPSRKELAPFPIPHHRLVESPRVPIGARICDEDKTDLAEFCSTVALDNPDLADRLQEWQHFDNWDRAHGSLHGKAPMRFMELAELTPVWDEVEALYDRRRERVRYQDYRLDLKLHEVERCLRIAQLITSSVLPCHWISRCACLDLFEEAITKMSHRPCFQGEVYRQSCPSGHPVLEI